MKSDQLRFRPGFRLSAASAKSQAAVMVSAVGGREGGATTFTKAADQWVYVVDGLRVAIAIAPGSQPAVLQF
jgi:hypothetical protein